MIEYAVTAIPTQKIMMGVPTYGRDWKIPYVQGTTARTFDPATAVQLAAQYNVPIQYHTTYRAPYFQYRDASGQEHIVWYEDARSFQAKCDLIKQYNLRGMSFWQWPSNFPQVWPVLADNFQVRKVI